MTCANLVCNQPPFSCGEPSPVHQTTSKGPRILVSTWACVLRKQALSQMTNEVFGRLHPCFRIPNDIPIRKAYKGEKCYTKDTEDIGFFEAAFIVELRLPFSEIHCRLADHLEISVFQIAPNAWRIFIRDEVLWGQ